MLALKKKGFTLIEIVIVLAIAALILVIVFLAVGGAQRSQRDNASQDASAKVVAAFASYLGDNDNKATINSDIPASYLTNIASGSGTTPTNSSTLPTATTKTLIYRVGATCVSGVFTPSATTGNSTQIAVAFWGETAGKVVCKSNQ
jgi:prepilin-type N-terminal cleavage/methylation domain-containing protein